jgi:hypothetical protein
LHCRDVPADFGGWIALIVLDHLSGGHSSFIAAMIIAFTVVLKSARLLTA